jgi:uroporphyrinogen-III decarboxylase
MTKKQRMLAAMRREKVDRVPASPIMYFMLPMKLSGYSTWNIFGLREPYFPWYKAVVNAYRQFGFESWFKGRIDVTIPGKIEQKIEQVADDRLEVIKNYHLPHGELTSRTIFPEYDAEAMIEYPVKDPAKEEALVMDLLDTDALKKSGNATLAEAQKYTGDDGIVTATVPSFWNWWLEMRGPQNGVTDFYMYPEVMGRIYKQWRGYERVYAEMSAKSPADALYGAASSFTSLSLISPELWEETVFDTVCDVARIAHEYKKPLCYMAGNIGMKVLLERIVATGTDAISPCERPPLGDWEMAEIRRRVGTKICVVGNVDPVSTLLGGTPQMVDAEIKGIIDDAGCGTGLIVATSDQVARDTSHENLKAFKAAVDKYGVIE